MAVNTAPAPFKEGQALRPYKTAVRSERQQRYHDAAEVATHLFADQVDLSVLANDTILAAGYLKSAAIEGLHAGQRMIQTAPVYLDEELSVEGCVADLRVAARGTFVTFAFDFVRADGSIPIKGELVSFRAGEALARAGDAGAGAGEGLDQSGLVRVSSKHLTPEKVAKYSFEFPDYSVHFDPAMSASIGFRAPVAPGLMSFTWMMEAVARDGLPEKIDISATFRRPIFWDDSVQVFWRGRTDLLIAKNDGLLCSTGRIATIER